MQRTTVSYFIPQTHVLLKNWITINSTNSIHNNSMSQSLDVHLAFCTLYRLKWICFVMCKKYHPFMYLCRGLSRWILVCPTSLFGRYLWKPEKHFIQTKMPQTEHVTFVLKFFSWLPRQTRLYFCFTGMCKTGFDTTPFGMLSSRFSIWNTKIE